MAEILKTTLLGFFRGDEGSTPVLQPRTQTRMADPLLLTLKSGLLWIALTLIRALALMGLSLKALSSHILTFPYLPGCLTFHIKLIRSLKIGAAQ